MHHGRPGTEVIPTSWADDHRPTAAGTMTGWCEIRQPDVKVEDEATNSIEWVPGPLILPGAVPCRVQRLNDEQNPTVGEQRISVGDYLITIPYTATDIPPGSVVRVSSSSDAVLNGKPIYVVAAAVGTDVWERDLFCSTSQTGKETP